MRTRSKKVIKILVNGVNDIANKIIDIFLSDEQKEKGSTVPPLEVKRRSVKKIKLPLI
jgi:hypothetical protein